MENWPLPIIICSAASDPREMAVTFRAMEAGAVACVEKPVATGDDFDPRCRNLLETVRLMSEVKVIRRWRKPLTPATRSFTAVGATPSHARVSVVGIGASTGGPPVLQTILAALPRDLPVPLLIVQHISPGFLAAMVEWLNQSAALRVRIATHGAQALPGHAYIAPDDFHLGYGAGGQLLLSKADEENGLRPAVSWLFRSLAPLGPATVGVLLTGMGKDGAAELKLMRDRGACTIAQDRESSVVHGMPGAAIALGGASQTLSADNIAGALAGLVNRRNVASGAWS
jgi:two-component system chemotaxis response regulator CheB